MRMSATARPACASSRRIGVVARFDERLAVKRHRPRKIGLERMHAREARSHLDALTPRRRRRERVLEQTARVAWISCLEVVSRGVHPSSHRLLGLVRRRKVKRFLDELGRRGGCCPRQRSARCMLETSATAESGASAPEARWRARSSRSSTTSARRRWSSRRRKGSAAARAADASSGCEKRIRSPSSEITSIRSAGCKFEPASSPKTAFTADNRGSESIAAAASTSRASAGRAARRPWTSSSSVEGTGKGSEGSPRSPRSSARAISRAKKGFPPDASRMRRSIGRGNAVPMRSWRIRWSAPSASGPT